MLAAPGLAIHVGGTSPLVQYSNTLKCKADGIIGTPIATADLPSLTTSIGIGPDAPAVTPIPTLNARYFTCQATVDPYTSAVTFSWVHGPDFSEITDIGRTKNINPGDPKKAIVGYICVINGSAADFVPGVTNLDKALVTTIYQDAFGYTGA